MTEVVAGRQRGRARRAGRTAPRARLVQEQVVELRAPGLTILLYSPAALAALRPGGSYVPWLPDGRDLVDHVNDCRLGAFGVRWPAADYGLHFGSTMDLGVIARACDHVRLGIEVTGEQLRVRGGEDLFRWDPRCPAEQTIDLPNGWYDVTVCMTPYDPRGTARIFCHFAPARAKPELGYAELPELHGEALAL